MRNSLRLLGYLVILCLGCHHADYSDVGDLELLEEQFGCAVAENAAQQQACETLADFAGAGPVVASDEERIYLGFTYCANRSMNTTNGGVHVTILSRLDGIARGVDTEHVPPVSMTRKGYRQPPTKTRWSHGFAEERSWQARMLDGTHRVLPRELEEWTESAPLQLRLARSDGVSLLPEGPGIRRPWYSRASDVAPRAFARAGSRDELLYLHGIQGNPCIERAYRVVRGPEED